MSLIVVWTWSQCAFGLGLGSVLTSQSLGLGHGMVSDKVVLSTEICVRNG